jgi:predicted RNA-binding Zn-ribbon protein involved in translation (DUF1610 family)
MSLILKCPNCGANTGIVENGKEHYSCKNNNGDPYCPNCGVEIIKVSTFLKLMLVVIIGICVLIGLMINIFN